MAVIRLAGFLGENRAIQPMMLAEGVGTKSVNQKPGRGDLRSWKSPSVVATVPLGTKTIYRMGRDVASDSLYWLSWLSTVDAVRGFDSVDTTERTFYTGDGVPKVTDNLMALNSTPYPTTWRPLGMPAPATAPLVSISGGTAEAGNATYFYAYTYVNDWGWESAPSPPSAEVTGLKDATRVISSFASPPAGNYQITRIRIYRTQATTAGDAAFYLLTEVGVGAANYSEVGTATLGEQLETTTWATPPTDLANLTALWNGMLAGISGAAVRFCEPYVPYAWPTAYDVVPPDSTPVALGVFGQSLLVLTTGRPLLVQGSGPDSMDQMPLEIPQACIAPRSVVSMGSGVAWASEDGLCFYGAGGARIITSGLLTREDWQAIVPSSIVGQMYEGLYFGSYDDGSGRKGFFIDPASPTGVFFFDTGYEAMHFDELRDQLYVLDGTQVKKWDAGSLTTVTFGSKHYRLPAPVNSFAWGEVIATAYPVTVHVDALEMDAAEVTKMVAKYPGTTSALTATTLRFTKSVTKKGPFRLPGGFSAQKWQLTVETTNPVQGVALAHSTSELRSV